jgi:serine/threonine protein kinase
VSAPPSPSATLRDLPEPTPAGRSEIQHPVGGKYRLEERLGEGALGVVHRAVHLGLEKAFALKLLKTSGAPTDAALARFHREALALGRLQHPHIVEVTDSGIDEPSGAPYLVMELLDGVPLSDLCRDQGPLPLARALPLLAQIADAVDAAHGAGVLHRDLKPGNILVDTADAERPRVKVLDFGLAELLAAPGDGGVSAHLDAQDLPGLTSTGALHGTPLYAAPEVIRHGEASPASDVYSFGVIAYELLGGHPPFRGSMSEVLAGHLGAEPPPLPLPPPVWRALRQALDKDPARRPRTAGEVVRGLREANLEAARASWKATEAPRRLRLAALLAASLAALGLLLPWPPVPPVERWIGDLRVRTSPPRRPDPRILLVTLDEASLDSNPRPLAARADEIGRTLSRMLEAGARGVALDLLPPAQWSASPGFSDLLLRHANRLTLAAFSDPEGNVVGTECVDGLTAAALGPRRLAGMFGFVNLDEDQDGVVRQGRLWFRDRAGSERPSWAAQAARGLGPGGARQAGVSRRFWIDTRIDWTRYARISWRQIPDALDRNPEMFRGRLVLVGGDFRGSGDDVHRIPHRSATNTFLSGLALQTLMVDTIAAGLPVREAGRMPVLALAALVTVLAAVWVLRARRAGRIAFWLAAATGLYAALSFPVSGCRSRRPCASSCSAFSLHTSCGGTFLHRRRSQHERPRQGGRRDPRRVALRSCRRVGEGAGARACRHRLLARGRGLAHGSGRGAPAAAPVRPARGGNGGRGRSGLSPS